MGLYEQIRDTAKEKGYSINRLEKELGFARSSINKFNKNMPSADKVQQIADFLHVSVDYLMTGKETDKKELVLTPKDERDIKKKLDVIMKDIKDQNDGPLYYNGEEVDPVSLSLLENALESAMKQLKIINKEKYNPNKNKK